MPIKPKTSYSANSTSLPSLGVVLIVCQNICLVYSKTIEAHIRPGRIRGEEIRPKWSADKFKIFKGIPYAAPPVGALRFQPPSSIKKWRGVMNATRFAPACLQRKYRKDRDFGRFIPVRDSEDCLYLNVFAPVQRWNETFAVMVWIHGGNFQIGSASDYRQDAILRHFVSRKVVFVTLNYRLGPLGFLCTGDDAISGNNGLHDIFMALCWIRDNIHEFGGNPASVTLIGHGSGGAAASLLALSPIASQYINRVIMMSGNALTPGMVRTVPMNATERLQKHLGCLDGNSTIVLHCLRDVSAREILGSDLERIHYDDYEEWVPVVDGVLIPYHPLDLIREPYKIPALLGTTAEESVLDLQIFCKPGINMTTDISLGSARYAIVNWTREYEGFENRGLISNGTVYEYLESRKNPNYDEVDTLKEGLLEALSDFKYHSPASRLASAYTGPDEKAYLYSYDHFSENMYSVNGQFRSLGAFHGSDLLFLMGLTKDFFDAELDRSWKVDRHVIELFSSLLTNFASYGNPTPTNSTYPNWTTFDTEKLSYYSIMDGPRMKLGYHWRGHHFWNKYAQHLDRVDVGNLHYIATLTKQLGDYQVATWVLLTSALFFFGILVGLACYCMRKDADEDDL